MDEPAETTPEAGAASASPNAAPAASPQSAFAEATPAEVELSRPGGGPRVLVALVMLPWLLGYGVIGTWTVVRGASAAATGLKSFDAGYTRLVSPAGVIVVGALLLAAFTVLLATSMLLMLGGHGATWAAVAVAAVLLVAGSVWAATRGGLSPVLWILFFFGLVYAAAVAIVTLTRATRAPGRGRIAPP